MDLWILKSGHKVRMRNGALAKVLSETEDGTRIRIEYLERGEGSPSAGVEDVAREQEVEALLGVAHPHEWGEEVAVMLHQVPESEEGEGGFEAVTMKGVPHGAVVTGHGSDSAEEALTQLLNGLEAFGFAGGVIVEDATGSGRPARFEVRVG